MPKIRIIQWREYGDDDDTVTVRIVHEGDETTDRAFCCDVYGIDPALSFEAGGITVIDTQEITQGVYQDAFGSRCSVQLEALSS